MRDTIIKKNVKIEEGEYKGCFYSEIIKGSKGKRLRYINITDGILSTGGIAPVGDKFEIKKQFNNKYERLNKKTR